MAQTQLYKRILEYILEIVLMNHDVAQQIYIVEIQLLNLCMKLVTDERIVTILYVSVKFDMCLMELEVVRLLFVVMERFSIQT